MPEDTPRQAEAQPREDTVTTRHELTLQGQRLSYTATAGLMALREEVMGKGEREGRFEGLQPKAEIFVVSYVRDGGDAAERPVTFCFNGGPGSSSVWLHLGAFGPRRVALDPEGNPTERPAEIEDNEFSLLDLTDLVFIDPVSTGFSRALTGEKPKEYHGFTKDIASVAEVIRLWCTRHGRWLSPKYLAAESYGTTRAAGLAGHLQERHGLFLDGLILLSTALDFTTLDFTPGNDIPPLLYLPAYAATAHYHGLLGPELQELELERLLQQVEEFTLARYAPALLRGATLPESERREVARELSRYSGLSETFIAANNLRIPLERYVKELLRQRRRTVGRLDSRYLGRDRDAGGESFEFDPSYASIQGPYTAALNHYLRRELGFESDLPYEILANLYETWSYKEFENRYVNVGDTLRRAMSMNPRLRVHVASGYYDLATPYFASDYVLSHLGLEGELHRNISTSYYRAGHMMYVHRPSHERLREELARFLAGGRDAEAAPGRPRP